MSGETVVDTKIDSGEMQNEVYDTPLEAALTFLLPGLLQGIAIWLLADHFFDNEPTAFLVALLMAVAVTPVAWFLTATRRTRIAAAIYALLLGLFIAGLYLLADASFGSGPALNSPLAPLSAVCGFLIAYISAPFFRTVIERGRRPTDYPSLFEIAWNLPVIAGAALLFTGALWIVLALWAALFDLLGIDFFADLFFDSGWAGWALTMGGFALAAAIARERDSIVLALRSVLFALLKILSPILTAATVLFAVAAVIQGIDVLWENWSATTTMVLAIAVAVALSNAVVGEAGLPGNAILRWSVRIQSLVLPVLAGFAVYGLWIRMAEYGFTVPRLYALVIVVFAALYSVAYFISALIPKGWDVLRQANIILAGCIFLMAIIVQTPLFNTWAWSVNDQIERLRSGEVSAAEFDYAYFQFEMGKAGQAGLDRMLADETLPEHDLIVELIEQVRAADSAYDFRNETISLTYQLDEAIADGRLTLLSDDEALYDALPKLIAAERWRFEGCIDGRAAPCMLRETQFLDLETPQYILFTGYSGDRIDSTLFWLEDGDWWQMDGESVYPDDKAAFDAFFEKVVAGNVQQGTITLRTVSVGGTSIPFVGMTEDMRGKLLIEETSPVIPEAVSPPLDETEVDQDREQQE